MILRRFYITENTNGEYYLRGCDKTDDSDQAPVPKSKANRVLKEIFSSAIPS